jgi:hypothetical protein
MSPVSGLPMQPCRLEFPIHRNPATLKRIKASSAAKQTPIGLRCLRYDVSAKAEAHE